MHHPGSTGDWCSTLALAGPQGAELRKQAAEETWNLVPAHVFVPWVRCTTQRC